MKPLPTKPALVTALVALVLAVLATPQAKAEYENRLIRLSHSLEDIAAELCEEFRIHYRHTRAYEHLVADAHEIEEEADHIHRLAHDPYASLRHIATDLRELDELAHHLHELVDRTEHGHYGHVHGSTRHVHELMTSLNRVIHSMEDFVDDLRHDSYHDDHHHGHHHGEGVRFERGGVRISLFR